MSKPLAEGDRVRVKDREQVAADIKSQLFYEHYRGLVGTVAKIYQDGTASVDVDQQALTKEVSKRHDETASGIKQRWLDGMSEEGRGKLTATEKQFNLRYTILLATADLEPYTGAASAPAKAEAAESAAPRKTLEEIDAEEARHFEEVRKQQQS